MDRHTRRQLTLLQTAIGNTMNQTEGVEHINYGQIWDWINDILWEARPE